MRSAALAVSDPQLEPLRLAVGLPEILSTEREDYRVFSRLVSKQWRGIHADLLSANQLRVPVPDCIGLAHLGSINWLAKGLNPIEPADRVQVVSEVIDLLRLGLKPIG